ncbi:MAG: hypothetical protein SH809_10475 [Rhodothermales bacterium]|nr:hypothetical protein [Rhodothermales bacterium]
MTHRSYSFRTVSAIVRYSPLWFVALATAACLRFDPPAISSVIADQSQRYPQMQVRDWYKLLHQAAMGSAHLGADSSAIYNYLLHEWNALDRVRPSEAMVEFISPDSQMVRLNLRPYKAAGGTPAEVYRMMTVSWASFRPSTAHLEEYMGQLAFMAKRGDVWLNADALAALLEEQRARDYPAAHHSETYERVYRPAYRVVLRSTLTIPPGSTP